MDENNAIVGIAQQAADRNITIRAAGTVTPSGGGTLVHFWPFVFIRIEYGVKHEAGIERIDGRDYTFGDLDLIFADPEEALRTFRRYLESLPRLPAQE